MAADKVDDDIRNVISLEEDLEMIAEAEAENFLEAADEGQSSPSQTLSPDEIERKLKDVKGDIPSFILKDVRENLRNRHVTEEKLNNIIAKVTNAYHLNRQGGSSADIEPILDGLNQRLNDLDEMVRDIKKLKSESGSNGKRLKKKPKAKAEPTKEQDSKVDDSINTKDFEELSALKPEEFLLVSNGLNGHAKGFRLEDIPEDVFSIMVSMKWLEFIIEKVGITNLPDILEFYSDMGWISDKVMDKLIKYARGTRPFHQEVDWKPEDKLTARDHMLSLLFVERLRGKKVSKDMLIQLDRELKKIKAGAEEIYGL